MSESLVSNFVLGWVFVAFGLIVIVFRRRAAEARARSYELNPAFRPARTRQEAIREVLIPFKLIATVLLVIGACLIVWGFIG